MAMIEKITCDNWRPGMPICGWLVRYGICITGGWKYMRCFDNIVEANKFFDEKNAED